MFADEQDGAIDIARNPEGIESAHDIRRPRSRGRVNSQT
jgi:hypothetical protein